MSRKTLWIGTSWKMNKLRAEARGFARDLAQSEFAHNGAAELFVIPPFTAVADVVEVLAGTRVKVGVQNLHWAEDGPWTGEISAAMATSILSKVRRIKRSLKTKPRRDRMRSRSF